jgi:hypothetical protein
LASSRLSTFQLNQLVLISNAMHVYYFPFIYIFILVTILRFCFVLRITWMSWIHL